MIIGRAAWSVLVMFLMLAMQEPQSIRGTVVSLGSNSALSGTRVELIKAQGVANTAAYTTTTSDSGAFVFSGVEPGEYRVLATRPDGYLPSEYGQRQPNARGTPINLNAGQAIRDLQLRMAAPGAISGRVLDRNGQPVGRAQVLALRAFYKDGRKETTIAQQVLANDLGEYRLFWLAPGQYYVSAIPLDPNTRVVSLFVRKPEESPLYREASHPMVVRQVLEGGQVAEEVHMPVYFPGTTDFQRASIMTLRSGETLTGRQIQLPAAQPSRHIRGVVLNSATGRPVADTYVVAVPRIPVANVVAPSAQTDRAGAYDIAGVIPGPYDVFAAPAAANQPVFAGGRTAVDVGAADLQNVNVLIPAPFDIVGRFTLQGSSDVDVGTLRVGLQRDPDVIGMPLLPQPSGQRGAAQAPQTTSSDGTFKLTGVGAGDYRLTIASGPGGSVLGGIRLPDSLYVKSIQLNSTDILKDGLHLNGPPDGRIEVALGVNAAAVSGVVVNDKREPIVNVLVALIPDEPLRRRLDLYKSAATDVSGGFTLRGVAPGNYKLFAWDVVENGAWANAEFLREFESRGTSIGIAEGDRKQLQLAVIAAQR